MGFSLRDFTPAGLNPFRGEEGFVALDIGSSSIKMVEAAKEKTGYRLVNIGISPLPPSAVQNNMVVDRTAVARTIQNLIQQHSVKAKRVISSVPGRAVMIKKIQLPVQQQEELEASVEFEAANVIPESLENVNLDYQILNYVEDGSKIEVLLVAVKKEIINSYTQAIQEARLTPVIVDVDYFAMETMYELNYEMKPDEVVGLIHIGAHYTSINVVKNGLSIFTGDLPVGGEAFTERLVEELKVSYEEAESLKVAGLAREKQHVDLDAVLNPLSHSLVDDIGRALTLYATMAGEEGIHSVYLSGGGAKISSVSALLETKLKVPVKLCEPFRGFSIARNIDKDLLAHSALALAIGAGLASRRPGDK